MNKLIFTLIIILISGSHSAGGKNDNKPPNVIILYSDQHNADVMGFMGHRDVITPNFDKLADEGVTFTRAYTTDAVCAPSRNSLMSGLYPRTLGSLANSDRKSPVMDEVISLARVFKNNGYETYAFGKRHMYQNVDEGWDVKKSHSFKESPNANYVLWIEKQGYAKAFAKDWAAEFGHGPPGSNERKNHYPKADMGTRMSEVPLDKTMGAYTAKETIKMINKHAENDRPFFCWATFYHPHQPYTPQPRFMKKYDTSQWGSGTRKGGAIKKPETLNEPVENLPPLLQRIRKKKTGIWNLGIASENEQLYRDYIGAYYALVSEVDYHIGQILQALRERGMEDNTIIIYSSDHGDFVGNHGMIEKASAGHNIYEETLRVPLIFRWKGHIPEDKKFTDLVLNLDIYPTLIDLAGLEPPERKWPLQGKSLTETILKAKQVGRKYIISENWSQATVITSRYKLGIWLDPTKVYSHRDFRSFGDMLFDTKKDSYEINNVLGQKKYLKVEEKLRGYYEAFTNKISDAGKSWRINKN